MLELKNIKTGYGSNWVLENLNLTVHPGEIHGILGINGAGKTTLFRTICGDLKKAEGSVSWMEQPLKRKDTSFLIAKPRFYPYMKGKEYLSLVSRNNPSFDFRKWNELFDLPMEAMVREYSTGMKKKIAFLGNIAQNRPVMILDEPFNGVDIESNEKLLKIIQRLKNDRRVILMASHMIDSLVESSDRISLLDKGRFDETVEKQNFAEWSKKIKSTLQGQIEGQLDELIA